MHTLFLLPKLLQVAWQLWDEDGVGVTGLEALALVVSQDLTSEILQIIAQNWRAFHIIKI